MDNEQKPTRPWDLLTKERVSDELANERFSICKNCPRLRKKINVCKECHCFMPEKVKLALSFCPLGNWQPHV
jgi:hypothetical protein